MDPDGELSYILGGALLGGLIGGAGGFISSAVSQVMETGKINWRKAGGDILNGVIIGAAQGGLVAAGVGVPKAVARGVHFLAGTAGTAVRQWITGGKADIRGSITGGIDNMIGNAHYGTGELKNVKDAVFRGGVAGALSGGFGYLTRDVRQDSGRTPKGILAGLAGKLYFPYLPQRDPRAGCGSGSPFRQCLGYSSAKGYRYTPLQTGGVKRNRGKFSIWEFFGSALYGAAIGGVSSAAFYGAGKGIEKLWKSIAPKSYMTGHDGEIALAKMYKGESQVEFKTSRGRRVVDQLSKGIAHESKVGYTSLSQSVRTQILKDAELVARGEVKGAHWHFFRSGVTGKVGATPQLLDFLKQNDISHTVH